MQKPLKIILISHNFLPVVGGTEIISNLLAKAFCAAGFEVHVITWTQESTEEIVPFQIVRNPSLRTLLREHKWADVVFENNPTLRLSWPNIFFRKPSVVVLHSWLHDENGKLRLQEHIKRLWLKRASSVIAVSDALRRKCWPSAKVIPNPYRIEEFKLLSEIPRIRDFVFLGRLINGKGAHLAIEAISKLSIEGFKTNLTLIGDGAEKEGLIKLANKMEVSDNVIFTGSLKGNDLMNSLNGHRFIIIPSTSPETFGMVALEGMACGCIPIASDNGGLPEAIGPAGLAFKAGNVDALVLKMKALLYDTKLGDQLRESAFDHLQAHRDNVIFERYLEVVKTVC